MIEVLHLDPYGLLDLPSVVGVQPLHEDRVVLIGQSREFVLPVRRRGFNSE